MIADRRFWGSVALAPAVLAAIILVVPAPVVAQFRNRAPANGAGKSAKKRSLPAEPKTTKNTPPPPPPPVESLREPTPDDVLPGQWALETLRLKDGVEYHGLVQAKRESEYDFAEIVQPPGQPMHAVIRGLPLESVAEVIRLPREQHQQLVERFSQFRNRALIEAGRIEQVNLQSEIRDGDRYRVYNGDWFQLLSTTDDGSTRRCVVRLEQIFRAYRTVLPPRTQPSGELQVYLYGSLDEYHARLRQLDLNIENAAFYAPRQRMIVAGSELTSFGQRMEQLRQQSQTLQRRYTQLEREFIKGLAVLSTDLRERGFTPEEITTELSHRKANWRSEMKSVLDGITVAQRQNEARFTDVTGQMFTRLYHEAFHAYLDHFVFPHDRQHVPRWLNEGLAQIFETGQLEGDLLRIDAPARDKLLALREDWQAGERLPLAELLTAADEPFLTPHANGLGRDEQRMYLNAWALAWHLAFQDNALGTPALDRYLAVESQRQGPLRRFEQLVEQPLPEFEATWRRAMRQLQTSQP